MRSVIGRAVAVLVALGLTASWGPAAAGGGEEVAFPDGVWVGQPAVWKGTVDEGFVFAEALANVDFGLTVEDGAVTEGDMKIKGKVASVVEGDPAVSVSGTVKGSYDLGGTGSVITVSGTVSFDLVADAAGIGSFPLAFSASGSGGRFKPSFATCNKVTGDLSTEHEKDVQAQGINASLEASFVAFRIAAPEEAEEVLAEYDAVVKLLLDLPKTPQPADLLAVASKIDALNAKSVGLVACEVAPTGFKKGLQDTLLSALFQDALDIFANAGQYSAQDLLALLGVGVRVGAVGLDVPGSKPLKDVAQSLFTEFEAALSQKVDAASAAGDDQTILDILVAAQQFGMDALADKAQGALAKVEP